MGIEFEDNSIKCKDAISQAGIAWLYESAGEIQNETQRNSKVRTGQTKGSWTYHVDEASGTATVGSDEQNAIWEEFGTGEYALNGDGRKGGWRYVDEKGVGHFTHGKKPQRMLYNAFNSLKTKIQQRAEQIFKGIS